MAPYDPILDYCGIVIQFGYMTFVRVLTLTLTLALTLTLTLTCSVRNVSMPGRFRMRVESPRSKGARWVT